MSAVAVFGCSGDLYIFQALCELCAAFLCIETLHKSTESPSKSMETSICCNMSIQAVPIECLVLLCNKSRMYL